MLSDTGKDRGCPDDSNKTRDIILKLVPLASVEENEELTDKLDSLTKEELELVEEYELDRMEV